MILHSSELAESNGRRPYELGGREVLVKHFVVRVTTPENPFKPHRHQQRELWYVVEGQAWVSLDGSEEVVQAGDLVVIDPLVEHGLRTEGQATWVCLG